MYVSLNMWQLLYVFKPYISEIDIDEINYIEIKGMMSMAFEMEFALSS